MSTFKWTDPSLPLPDKIAACFFGWPRRVKVEACESIDRLRSNRQGSVGTSIWESPWWFPVETYRRIVGRANKIHVRIVTSARDGLAVPRRFNEDLDILVIVNLVRPGFAYRGPAAPQTWIEQGITALQGGLDHLWVPGLQQHELRFQYFGHMEDRV